MIEQYTRDINDMNRTRKLFIRKLSRYKTFCTNFDLKCDLFIGYSRHL